jgi:hypothetical protein
VVSLAYRVLAEVLCDLEHEPRLAARDLEGVEDGREVAAIKLHVHDGTNDGHNLASGHGLGIGTRCVDERN